VKQLNPYLGARARLVARMSQAAMSGPDRWQLNPPSLKAW